MALRNAFEAMATEGTLKTIAEFLLSRREFARDAGDRVRAVLDSTSAIYTIGSYWGNANTYPTWYSTGAPTSMDPREQQAAQSQANFNQVRQQRWVI